VQPGTTDTHISVAVAEKSDRGATCEGTCHELWCPPASQQNFNESEFKLPDMT